MPPKKGPPRPPDSRQNHKTTRSHKDTVDELCLLCLSKGQRVLPEQAKPVIQQHVFSAYLENQDVLPKRLCNSCYQKLYSQVSQVKRPLPPPLDFTKMSADLKGLDVDTLSSLCACPICRNMSLPVRPGQKRQLSCYHVQPTAATPPASQQALPVQGQTAAAATVPEQHLLCPRCLGPVGRGLPHSCTREARVENAEKVLTPRSSQHLASRIIRQQTEASGSGTIQLQNFRGKSTSVTATPTGTKAKRRLNLPDPLPHSALEAIQVSENMSGRAISRTAQALRAQGVPVQPNLERSLAQKQQRLSEYFDLRSLTFKMKTDKGETQVMKQVVCTKDAKGLMDFIKSERRVNSCRAHFGLDGGGGFLKLCLNVIEEPRTPSQSPVAKKPPAGASRFLDSGVKKLLVVAIVANVQENYHNVKTLLDASNIPISSLQFSLGTDMKLANILCGIMQHSSVHPCCWCEISREYSITPETVPKRRTLGRIREFVRRYKECLRTGKKVRPQDFFNCIEMPLFTDLPDDIEILDLIPPPELHLMMGVVSKLYEEVLARLERDGEDRKKIEHWAAAHNIVREEYRGGTMEGNKCRALLKQAVDLGKQLPQQYRVFAVALIRFSKVVTACFSKELVIVDGKEYQDLIPEFHQAYLDCGISITPKVHAVIMHVPEWCARKGKGLGLVSEQASESVHHDFRKKWEHFKVQENNPRFGNNLRNCIVHYNSSHI